LPLKFSNEIGVPKKEKFSVLGPEKDWTTPKFFGSHTPIVMENCYNNVLAQKKGQNVKKPDFQTLVSTGFSTLFMSFMAKTLFLATIHIM